VLPDAIVAVMRGHDQQITVRRSNHEPVVGALLLALEEHGMVITDAILTRIGNTLPPGWH
jgi:hypothetical protein